jgi:hypothetical protein
MHSFHPGQTVLLGTRYERRNVGLSTRFKIVSLIPNEGDGPRYRVKGQHEACERVALERDLTLDRSAFV